MNSFGGDKPPISVPTENRPQLFVKNPVQIEACQFTDEASAGRILSWMGMSHGYYNGVNLYVRTLESAAGYHEATPGDWIIRGIKGEFYPCKPDIFAETYRPAASSSLLPVPLIRILRIVERLEQMGGLTVEHELQLMAIRREVASGQNVASLPQRELLAKAAIVLEGLAASVEWEIAPAIMKYIRDLLPEIRAELTGLGLGESREPLPDPRCIVRGHSSRVCELGTKCCVVQHSEWRDNEPLPQPIVMKGVMCGHPDCPCTGGYLHDPKDLVPSVPAEIESQQSSIEEDILAVIRLVRMRPTQLMEMMRKYTYTEIQDALQSLITKHAVILSNDRYLDAKLIDGLADSTPTQENP